MTLAAQIATIFGAILALVSLLRSGIELTFYRRSSTQRRRQFELKVGTRILLRSSRSERSVSLEVPDWALILFEPEEAQRWSKEVESHIWELLEKQAVRQARSDRRKLIVRGVLLAIVLRVGKRLRRVRRRQ
jgi:hypothetical protein